MALNQLSRGNGAIFETPDLVPSPSIPTTFTDNLPLPRLFVFDLDYTLWPFWVDTHCTPPLRPANAREANRSSRSKAKPHFTTQQNEEDSPISSANTAMVDRYGEHFSFYPGVPAILYAAKQKGISMSIASRTHAPDMAREMLRGLHIVPPPPPPSEEDINSQGQDKKSPKPRDTSNKPLRASEFFIHPQMYPGSKTSHFRKIQSATQKDKTNFPDGAVAYEDMIFFDDEGRNRNVESELGAVFVLVRDGVTAAEVDRGVWEWRRRKRIGQTNMTPSESLGSWESSEESL